MFRPISKKILLLITIPIFYMIISYTTILSTTVETTMKNPINAKHLKCLATGIYYESKGEAMIGQIAVARVIMNRVLHGFADNPCDVVYQTTTLDKSGIKVKSCQFSWVCENKPLPQESNPSFIKAMSIARQVLEEDKWNDVVPNNTLFFHNLTVSPRWTYDKVVTIGNHIFYSNGLEKNIESSEQNE